MNIEYKSETLEIEDLIELGYEAERVEVKNLKNEVLEIGGYKKVTELFISLPFLSEENLTEIKEYDEDLKEIKDMVNAYLIVDEKFDTKKLTSLSSFEVVIDYKKEFGDMYGLEILNGSLEGKLTKSLIIVSKDGTLFYEDIAKNVEDNFNIDTFLYKMNVALNCYTGKGCHDV